MSSVEANWQTTRPSLIERCKFLFNSELLSDVKLLVGKSHGGSESEKDAIPAHKFVLSIGSPVFQDLFYGDQAKSLDTLPLLEYQYRHILELLRYMYSDEVNLDDNNVTQVMCLAHQYKVPSLYTKCTEYLQQTLNASNVFCALPYVLKFDEEDLVDRCWNLIDHEAEKAIASDGFVTIDRTLLEAVVKRDSLKVKEIDLFKSVDRWATENSKSKATNAKRKMLGEGVVKGIRFPLMSETEFASVVPDSNILTVKEIGEILKHYNNVLSSPLQFSQAPRSPADHDEIPQRLRRFSRCFPPEKRMWDYCREKPDVVGFHVNKAIRLLGVHFYGCEERQFSVTLNVKSVTSGCSLATKSGSYNSVKQDSDGHFGFDVFFNSPLRLKAGVVYELEASIDGPHSWFGENGKKSVYCSGVAFNFTETNICNQNGTDVDTGQFPELIFSQ